MPRVFYVHWNEQEATERARPLRDAGFDVDVHWNTEEAPTFGPELPDAFVFSLDRLPSHGRAIAGWVWEAKKRQSIPLVFVGGVPDKVVATRMKFPRATYCKTGGELAVLQHLFDGTAP